MRILCLPTLINNLSNHRTTDPFFFVNSYVGKDWEKMVCGSPVSLWKNDHMELKLNSWKMGRIEYYYNNYSTIHTKVLDGELSAKIILKHGDFSFNRNIKVDENYTFHPFSNVSLRSLKPSFTLQLYYFHHFY